MEAGGVCVYIFTEVEFSKIQAWQDIKHAHYVNTPARKHKQGGIQVGMSWKGRWIKLKGKRWGERRLGQTFGYKPWSDFGPLGRNRALPSCHSSLYQQRDEEPSSLERGGRAQRQETIKEKGGGGIERRKQIKQTGGCFTLHLIPVKKGFDFKIQHIALYTAPTGCQRIKL